MKFRILISIFVLSSCQNRTTTDSFLNANFITFTKTVPPLKLVPENVTIPVSANYIFSGTGGTPPYTYTITNKVGTIGASTGIFSATVSDTATISIKDSAGASALGFASTYVSGQSPNGMANLVLWLKADSYSMSDGAFSAGTFPWINSANPGVNNLTAGSAQFRNNAYNNQPVVAFNGSSHTLTFGASISVVANTTLFAVSTPSASVNGTIIYGSGTGDTPVLQSNVGGSNRSYEIYWQDGGQTDSHIIRGNASGLNLIVTSRQGLTATGNPILGYYNSFQSVNTGAATSALGSPTWLGLSKNARWFNGDIAEIILFNSVLPDTTRQAIECYLMKKYAITSASLICN